MIHIGRGLEMQEQEKLIFHPISLEDRDWMNEKLREEKLDACEYTFANNYMWADVYDVRVGSAYGCGVIRCRGRALSNIHFRLAMETRRQSLYI